MVNYLCENQKTVRFR